MNYLLDTHTLLHVLMQSKSLSSNIRTILDDVENNFYVSAISFWEISIKYSLQKLELNGVEPDRLISLCSKSNFKFLDMSCENGATYWKLAQSFHKDPFDKMLIWQAITYDYTLISRDNDIKKYEAIGLKLTS